MPAPRASPGLKDFNLFLAEGCCVLGAVAPGLCHSAALAFLPWAEWVLGLFGGCVVAFLLQRCFPVLEEGGMGRCLQNKPATAVSLGHRTADGWEMKSKLLRASQLPSDTSEMSEPFQTPKQMFHS